MNKAIQETEPYVIAEKASRFEFLQQLELSSEAFSAVNPHVEEIDVFEPGMVVNIPPAARLPEPASNTRRHRDEALTALDWAVLELEKTILSYDGPYGINPELEKYHGSAVGVSPDDVPWCSSFVNWCLGRAFLTGTNNRAARSWHRWGCGTDSPVRGDIAVFIRKDASWKGHVGFYWEDDGRFVSVLGGNQSNAVSISAFPKEGRTYRLLSIRKIG
jgi:uncharacterized protein (TIGR02594 family)